MSISILRKSFLLRNHSVKIVKFREISRQIPYVRTFATEPPPSSTANENSSEKGSTENKKSKFKIDKSHILPAILSLWTVLTIDNYFELGIIFRQTDNQKAFFYAIPSEDIEITDENVRQGRLPIEKRQRSTEVEK